MRDLVTIPADSDGLRLTKHHGNTLFEVVELKPGGAPSAVLFRRDGVAPAESYSKLEVRHMVRMKMTAGGFDGLTTYAEGEIVRVALEHAKMAFLAGNGRPVDDGGKLVPVARAAQLLGVRDDDLAGALPSLRAALTAPASSKKRKG